MRDRQGYIFDDSNWRYAFFGGYRFEWQPGVANLDATAFFFLATGVTPAMDTTSAGKESTWVQTISGHTWFTTLRLDGPLEPWFNRTWRPGEIEPL
jgi:hypothetical protein